LLDHITQRQDAQIQQMQHGMFAIFGMVQQLVTHTGLVPQQQAGLQGMSASALAPTLTPATATISAPGISSWDFLLSSLLASTTGVALPITC
jgi:hypothetical protein